MTQQMRDGEPRERERIWHEQGRTAFDEGLEQFEKRHARALVVLGVIGTILMLLAETCDPALLK